MTETTRQQFEVKLMKFRAAVDGLKRHRSTTTLEAFRANSDTYFAVCYLFVMAIEALVDLGQYLLIFQGKRAEGQSSIPELLARQSIIDEPLAKRLKDMIGFRNILIHAYPEMNDAKVATYLNENLEDFDAFLAAVNRTMK
ncbi:MAG: DUF86 domain-containing protein [Candidatus Uhrbacteria bacterium]